MGLFLWRTFCKCIKRNGTRKISIFMQFFEICNFCLLHSAARINARNQVEKICVGKLFCMVRKKRCAIFDVSLRSIFRSLSKFVCTANLFDLQPSVLVSRRSSAHFALSKNWWAIIFRELDMKIFQFFHARVGNCSLITRGNFKTVFFQTRNSIFKEKLAMQLSTADASKQRKTKASSRRLAAIN